MANQLHALDDLLRALADPTRRAVLERLCEGQTSITDLARPFDMALPSFMKHVRILEESGLINTRKKGRVRTCSLQPSSLAVLDDWLARQRRTWERHTDRLEQFVLGQPGKDSAE